MEDIRVVEDAEIVELVIKLHQAAQAEIGVDPDKVEELEDASSDAYQDLVDAIDTRPELNPQLPFGVIEYNTKDREIANLAIEWRKAELAEGEEDRTVAFNDNWEGANVAYNRLMDAAAEATELANSEGRGGVNI